MLFYKHRRKIIRYFRYRKVLFHASLTPVKEKSIYLDITGIAINRYLYAFLKMFQLEGYSVFIPKNLEVVNILSKSDGEFKYASWLLSEKVVKFGKPKTANLKEISLKKLSNDFFNPNEAGYHVPMSFYPWFYKNYQLLEREIEDKPRKNSIFMSGNIDPKYYDQITNSSYFNQPSRFQIANFLSDKDYNLKIKSMNDLDEFLTSSRDGKLILINTIETFRIDLKIMPGVLRNFSFYLALPGIVIPQSHNLIEAMACGCIPIIHAEYAGLMDPILLKNKNAFMFKNINELDKLIERVFTLNEVEIEQMRIEVFKYYDTYLSPYAVVRRIENQNFEKIYIQAEHISLRLLEN